MLWSSVRFAVIRPVSEPDTSSSPARTTERRSALPPMRTGRGLQGEEPASWSIGKSTRDRRSSPTLMVALGRRQDYPFVASRASASISRCYTSVRRGRADYRVARWRGTRLAQAGRTWEMKLAEALALRADCQRRLEQLKQRLLRNAQVQEGDEPSEDPVALLAEFEQVSEQLLLLIQRINRTNAESPLGASTMTDALARRDVLRLSQDAYRELAQAASVSQARTTRSEVKFRSTVSVVAIQKKADELSKEHRELDARIQEANWRIDLT